MRHKMAGCLVAVTFALLAPAAAPSTAEAAAPNVVVEWNHIMLSTFATANVPPPPGNRLGAIVQAAVFDAVNGIERRYTPIHVEPAAPRQASVEAAAINAAHSSLVALFPTQKTSLDAALATSMSMLGAGTRVEAGASWGRTVAEQILAWRAHDGSNAPAPAYVFRMGPGDWQPTPGGTGPPKFQQLATTTPFALESTSQFRPAGPPALTSARYARDFNEVKALGGNVSATRTAFQTETARFWQLDTVTAMWDRVADSLALEHHLSLVKTARLLAQADAAMADATFAIWDAKVAFNFWRPVTAIVNAGADNNPATSPDPTWLPLLVTAYFQEYPSGHAGVSSAAASVLASTFGQDTEFTMTSAGLPGVEHSFSRFADAVSQVIDARVWVGFHFRFSDEDAAALGRKVGTVVQAKLMLPRSGPENDQSSD